MAAATAHEDRQGRARKPYPVAAPSPAFRCLVEAQWPLVGNVALVADSLAISLRGERGMFEYRCISREDHIHRGAPQGDFPFAVTLFEAVYVAAADHPCGFLAVVEERDDDIAFAMSHIAINLAGVSRYVMSMQA